MAPAQLLNDARISLQQAIEFSFDNQQSDGHWFAEVSADVTFSSQYVMFKYAMGFDLKGDGDALRRWLLQDQTEDGSWALAPKNPGNISTTTEANLALKILAVSADNPAMLKEREWMIKNGCQSSIFYTFLSGNVRLGSMVCHTSITGRVDFDAAVISHQHLHAIFLGT